MNRWIAVILLVLSWMVGFAYFHNYDWVTVGIMVAAVIAMISGSAAACSWMALALLSLSWLAGTGYYHHPDWPLWTVMAVVAIALLTAAELPIPVIKATTPSLALRIGASFALIVASLCFSPWPVGAIPLAIALGLLFSLFPEFRRWPRAIGAAAVSAGVVLAIQAIGIYGYQSVTGRVHETPQPIADVLGFIARLVGIDAATDGSTVALHTMRKLHEVGALWDWVLDPATFCFLVGGMTLVALRGRELPAGARVRPVVAAWAKLILCLLAWLPIRAALMESLVIHRALRTEFESPLILMDQFRSTWVFLAMLIVPTALAARFVRMIPAAVAAPAAATRLPAIAPMWRRFAAAGVTLAAVFTITFAGLYDPVGPRKAGRILMDEFHSSWEPFGKAFDTTWYGHDSGYNYYCIYDYLHYFYSVDRVTTRVTDATLANCDVFISKVPTSRYDDDEKKAIEKFVRNGGGLFLVGEHTDVFGTGVALNDLAAPYGFSFRYDVILDTDTSFEQALRPHWIKHPGTQYVGDFDFAVTCSIDPGASSGRAAVLSRSLRSLGPEYHASNFYPPIDDASDERYGAFVQAWATRAGEGRVFAWSDSTDWSNFCAFEPGKIEMLESIVEWLNHRNTSMDPRPMLWVLALILSAGALWLSVGWEGGFLTVLCAGYVGWILAAPVLRSVHWHAMPKPSHGPFHRVIMDRTVCTSPLSKGGFIEGKPDGFGVFERWILRLGYFIKRASGADALHDDLVVFTYPHGDVTPEFRRQLIEYVRNGGKVLVIDAPENASSTANSLLYPFNLEVKRQQALPPGDLVTTAPWPSTKIASACETAGGEPLFRLGDKPVASTMRFGKGCVTVVGFGSRLADPAMGVTGDTMPDEDLTKTYALDYALMGWLVEDKKPPPATQPAATEPATQPTTTQAATESLPPSSTQPSNAGNVGAEPVK
jgi:hypothetical protein